MVHKKAVALKYSTHDNAPKVVAIGKGEMAERILSIAAKNGVPVLNKTELVDKLITLELNQEIPMELYEVVAEILAFVYQLEKRIEKY